MNALVLYFDGKCPFCAAEMQRLSAWDTQHRLAFVDIAQEGFDCSPLNVDLAALNRELHGRTPDGRLLVGIDMAFALPAPFEAPRLAGVAVAGTWAASCNGEPVPRLRKQSLHAFTLAGLRHRNGL